MADRKQQAIQELQRRYQSGEMSERQRAAFQELQKRGVFQAAQPDRPANLIPPSTGGVDPELLALARNNPDTKFDFSDYGQTTTQPGPGQRFPLTEQQEQAARASVSPRPGMVEFLGDAEEAGLEQSLRQAGQQPVPQLQDYQQRQMERVPRPLRPIASGLTGSVGSSAALGAQVTDAVGLTDGVADDMLRDFGGVSQARRELGTSLAEDAFEGAIQSISDVITTGPAGTTAVIGNFVAKAVQDAEVQGREAGLEGAELGQYMLTTGAIEGAVTAAFQRVGLGGLEKSAGRVMRQTVRETLKRAGIQTAGELGEELLITLGQAVADDLHEVDPDALTAESLRDRVATTTLSTLMTMGMAEGGRALGNNLSSRRGQKQQQDARRQLPESTPEAVPPRTEQEERFIGVRPQEPDPTPAAEQRADEILGQPLQTERPGDARAGRILDEAEAEVQVDRILDDSNAQQPEPDPAQRVLDESESLAQAQARRARLDAAEAAERAERAQAGEQATQRTVSEGRRRFEARQAAARQKVSDVDPIARLEQENAGGAVLDDAGRPQTPAPAPDVNPVEDVRAEALKDPDTVELLDELQTQGFSREEAEAIAIPELASTPATTGSRRNRGATTILPDIVKAGLRSGQWAGRHTAAAANWAFRTAGSSIRTFKDFSQRMVSEFGASIRGRIRPAWQKFKAIKGRREKPAARGSRSLANAARAVADADPDVKAGDAPADMTGRFFAAQARETLAHPDDDFVLVDLPLDRVDVNPQYQPEAEAEFAGQSAETAPPALGGRAANGDSFVLIDGNTRARAARKRGDTTIKAYVPASDAAQLTTPAPQRERRSPENQKLRDQIDEAQRLNQESDQLIAEARGLIDTEQRQREALRSAADVNPRKQEPGMMEDAKAPMANRILQGLAKRYTKARGYLAKTPPTKPIADRTARRLARAYETMQHNPTDPAVEASYVAFRDETLDQFNLLKQMGYQFELKPAADVAGEYPTVAELAKDLAENRHLSVNEDPGDMPPDHPMMEIAPGTGRMTHNQVFRAVHDVFGHGQHGFGFDIAGEENAWRSHSQMYSDLARGAMTTETRGQSTWVGYGPFEAANKQAIEEDRIGDVVFPPQKAGLLPEEFWTMDGLRPMNANTDGGFSELNLDETADAVLPNIEHVRGQNAFMRALEKGGMPIASSIRRWAPRMYGALKQHQARYRRDRHDADYFAHKLDRALKKMGRKAYERTLYSWQSGDFDAATRIIQENAKNPSEVEELAQVTLALKDSWHREGKAAGLQIGEIENHFPRYLKPGMYEEWTEYATGQELDQVQRMIDDEARRIGRKLSIAEKTDVVNKWLAGHNPQRPGSTRPKIVGKRSVEDLTFEEWKRFYQTDMTPLYTYFDRLIYNTHKARLFGKKSADESLDESIGRLFVEGKYGVDKLTPYQKNRLRSAINSVYTGGEQSPATGWRWLRDLGYMGTLLDPSSAAIQFGDLALIAARDGSMPMLRALPKSVREKVLTAKNLGMEHLSEEYGSHGKMATALRRGFKMVGFHKIDTAALTVNMVSAVREAERFAKKGKGRAYSRFVQEWGPVYGEQFPQLLRDLRHGVVSDLVQDYAYMQASETRPNDIMDMPEAYAKHPNARILWQLKGFAMKQFDFIRTRAYSKIARGVRHRDPKIIAGGVGELVRLMMMLSMAGATFDWIRDWALGRDPDFPESLVDGLLYTHLGSLYLLQSASQDGPGSAAVDFITPPAPGMLDTLWRDLATGNYRSVKYLPFGKTLYSMTPDSAERNVKYARLDVLEKAAKMYQDGDLAAARTYINAFNRDMKERGRDERLSMSSVRRSVAARERNDDE